MDRVKQIAAGAQTLIDWLGAGGIPVDRGLAQHRASVCAQCPLNVLGNWIDRVTSAIAEAIRQQRSAKTELQLVVAGEDMLGTCQACGCHLPLKVWVPASHIIANTSAETFQLLDPGCWILNENSNDAVPNESKNATNSTQRSR